MSVLTWRSSWKCLMWYKCVCRPSGRGICRRRSLVVIGSWGRVHRRLLSVMSWRWMQQTTESESEQVTQLHQIQFTSSTVIVRLIFIELRFYIQLDLEWVISEMTLFSANLLAWQWRNWTQHNKSKHTQTKWFKLTQKTKPKLTYKNGILTLNQHTNLRPVHMREWVYHCT